MRSVMTHSFAQVPKAEIPRSTFDRSHGHKTTFDAGWLIPIYHDEALPGDTFTLRTAALMRLATPQVPIMDNLRADFFFFSVPIRLIWSNFQRFMGERDPDPDSSIDYTVPQIDAGGSGFAQLSLSDYLGLPIEVADLTVSSFWHRAYNLIWNQWFRDQNLQDSVPVDTDDGPDAITDYVLLRRGKRHDYFTSALPWLQKGDAVEIPLGTSADVVLSSSLYTNQVVYRGSDSVSLGSHQVEGTSAATYLAGTQFATAPLNTTPQNAKLGIGTSEWSAAGIYADLSTATAATINLLRQGVQVQKLLERDARGGTRYIEIVKAHFGVTSPDARLQRPELLGMGSVPINIHSVPQTSETGTTPQGTLAAYGTAVAGGVGFTASFTEHCVLLGLVSVRADLTYQQGLDRSFSRSTRYDFYWPALSHIGEQSVLSKEIYCDGTANDEDVFGYQERYAEYRFKRSEITGQFRSGATTPLDMWHLSQEFSPRPTLSASFIVDNPPVDRVIADANDPHIIADFYHHLICARPMPVYGVPGMMDHF